MVQGKNIGSKYQSWLLPAVNGGASRDPALPIEKTSRLKQSTAVEFESFSEGLEIGVTAPQDHMGWIILSSEASSQPDSLPYSTGKVKAFFSSFRKTVHSMSGKSFSPGRSGLFPPQKGS